MRRYLGGLPEYMSRVLPRADTVGGIVVGFALFLVAIFVPPARAVAGPLGGAFVFFAVIEASYAVYLSEREMRVERDRNLWIDARLASLAANYPDPGPDKVSLTVKVICELWTSIDVTTSDVGLNVIYGYRNHRWELWKKGAVRMTGLPPNGEESTAFRRSIRAADPQPIRWQFEFDYAADRKEDDPHWLLELVIKTGIPPDTFRIPLSPESIYGPRPVNPPL